MKILVTESQMGKILITEQRKCDVFTNQTSAQDYDDILSNEPGRYLRTLQGSIVQMSPEEYFDRVAQLQDTTYDEQFTFLDKHKVKNMADEMSSGRQYDLPYINYNNKHQEGRHRVAAAQLLGCKMVNIGVFNKPDFKDPYVETTDEVKQYTLEALEDKLEDVYIDHDGVFISYIHDWNHPKDVRQFLNLYPSFDGKGDLFYERMSVLWMPEHTNEFEFDSDAFVLDEDPKELTNYIWEQILSHTTQEQLNDMGYGGDDKLDFSEVCSWLNSVARDLDVLKDLNKYIHTMLNSVFLYTFYKNNWDYFQEVDSKYRVVFEKELVKVYSEAEYSWDDRISSGKELLEENDVRLSNEDPVMMARGGYYALFRSDVEDYLKKYPIS